MRRYKRKSRKFKNFLLFIFVIALIYVCNVYFLTVNEIEIYSDKINGDIKIVQITDLHGYSFGFDNSWLIKTIEKQEPDIVVVTGDMYTFGDEKGKEVSLELMKNLAEEFPVYYVNGEHDNSDSYFESLKANNVNVLRYDEEKIVVGDSKINLYGINNVYYSDTFDLANEFTIDTNEYNLLLAHIANFEDFADFGMDLSLCGDTHGGQIRLPFIGALYANGVWLPEDSGQEVKGLYEHGNSKLFVSSGLGCYMLHLRLFNQPEVAVITLKNSET